MDYKQFIKKITLPAGASAPTELTYEDLRARPLARVDLAADLQAVNPSIEVIQSTRGGSGLKETLGEDFDLVDLAWHEREFREGNSFSYVIYNSDGKYIGCFYLYPMGWRAPLTEELVGYEVDASWWVSAEAYERGYYLKLYQALQQWLPEQFKFSKVYYSNKQLP